MSCIICIDYYLTIPFNSVSLEIHICMLEWNNFNQAGSIFFSREINLVAILSEIFNFTDWVSTSSEVTSFSIHPATSNIYVAVSIVTTILKNTYFFLIWLIIWLLLLISVKDKKEFTMAFISIILVLPSLFWLGSCWCNHWPF